MVFMSDFVIGSVQIHDVGGNCWSHQQSGGKAKWNLYHPELMEKKPNCPFPNLDFCWIIDSLLVGSSVWIDLMGRRRS